ncbi:hypothetical protein PYW08_012314 [Mythimna loreyi]|uniref:Uncharacterized protein n=1 Tax=Mythimna loreyi TaxID=667449 RepID=A0ACC2Q0B5_9NEOP|nr:hypothetical protein PYW08_012314 [Mythimna loreyi]
MRIMRKKARLSQEDLQFSGSAVIPTVSSLDECELEVKEEILSNTEEEDESDESEEEHETEAAISRMSNVRKRKLETVVPDKETMDDSSEKLTGNVRGPSRRRVTYNQLEALWEILDKNRDLATGFNKTSQAREYSRRMWKTAAETLNAQDDGAEKDWKGWCKYWNDYKSKLKSKVASARAALQKNEGGTSNEGRLTDLEIKYLQILGDDFGASLPRVKVEPFDVPIEDWIKAESGPQNGNSESIMAHHLIIEPLIPSEPPPEAPPPAASPPSPPTPAASPHASASPPRRRHRQRRMKPMSADAARRALVNTSEERLRIEERRNQILENLTLEIRELKYVLMNRLPALASANQHT